MSRSVLAAAAWMVCGTLSATAGEILIKNCTTDIEFSVTVFNGDDPICFSPLGPRWTKISACNSTTFTTSAGIDSFKVNVEGAGASHTCGGIPVYTTAKLYLTREKGPTTLHEYCECPN